MANLKLWDFVKEVKGTGYKWVDLTHELSPETPHWYGFKPLEGKLLFDYREGTPDDMMAPMRCIQYSVASQYGTHVDVPLHFWGDGRDMSKITVKELVYPLVVVDKSKECAENAEFTMTVADLEKWESENGRIPEGAFVAFRSDWYKKSNLDNPDENGNPHYPGWSVDAIKWLVEERNIGAIGHEPADTDPSYVTTKEDAYPYPGEQYILETDRIQIEVMRNLDQVPAVGAMIVCAFPKLKDGTGFPARCFAICPED
ncbi:cyclase family protein [Anaerosacchariphilus sp. NSJ-68]|uniref:Cyclase family protein n=2 Tax=Lachnospiraceae TaxID=186803 RepID=A0A923LDN7_9FIRM|nr:MULTISPECIES: cyclase family protein [Lachnospiraceae]MBC5660182.1 cyclase family protein [Anaerosacchariphilus hominis]MBC5699297.1 cyclase family protein [Roseburia difficilis]